MKRRLAMSNIDTIIESVKKVFNMSEENISSLSVMLNNIDANHIYSKFRLKYKENNYSKEELISKTNLLNALMEIVLENPNLMLLTAAKGKIIKFPVRSYGGIV